MVTTVVNEEGQWEPLIPIRSDHEAVWYDVGIVKDERDEESMVTIV